MVYTEYLISYPRYGSSTSPANDVNVESSIWEIISSSLDIFTQLTVPAPLMDDGNFPWMPEGCQQDDDMSERALLGSSTSFLGRPSNAGDSCELYLIQSHTHEYSY